MTRTLLFALALVPITLLSACATTPEPEPIVIEETAPVFVEPVRTCIPVNELERVVVPAVIKRGTSVTSVEPTPEFATDPETGKVVDVTPPAQEIHTPFERLITPEQIYYINGEGDVVEDVCSDTIVIETEAEAKIEADVP